MDTVPHSVGTDAIMPNFTGDEVSRGAEVINESPGSVASLRSFHENSSRVQKERSQMNQFAATRGRNTETRTITSSGDEHRDEREHQGALGVSGILESVLDKKTEPIELESSILTKSSPRENFETTSLSGSTLLVNSTQLEAA
jgi:hypothetical protein